MAWQHKWYKYCHTQLQLINAQLHPQAERVSLEALPSRRLAHRAATALHPPSVRPPSVHRPTVSPVVDAPDHTRAAPTASVGAPPMLIRLA